MPDRSTIGRITWSGSTARIRIEGPTDDLDVVADRSLLETAVLNLAINARDAMPEGGELTIVATSVTLSHDPELTPGDYIGLRIIDTGTGCRQTSRLELSTPFYYKSMGKGTGLGLSQVYGMARYAGGAARIESRPAQGTSVSLLLKRVTLPNGPQ